MASSIPSTLWTLTLSMNTMSPPFYLARANAKLRGILRRRTREIAGDSKSARKQRSCGGVAPPFFCKAKGLSKLNFAEGTFAIQILLYVRERPEPVEPIEPRRSVVTPWGNDLPCDGGMLKVVSHHTRTC